MTSGGIGTEMFFQLLVYAGDVSLYGEIVIPFGITQELYMV
jgi:hypothetical protein